MGYMEDGIALVMVYEGNGVWSSNSVGLFGSYNFLPPRLQPSASGLQAQGLLLPAKC